MLAGIMDRKVWGETLRRAREAHKGLTQAKAAAMVGASPKAWFNYEKGLHAPIGNVRKAVDAFIAGALIPVRDPSGAWQLVSADAPEAALIPQPHPALTPDEHAALLARLEAAHGLYRTARLFERPDGSLLIEVTFDDDRRYREERDATGRVVEIERPEAIAGDRNFSPSETLTRKALHATLATMETQTATVKKRSDRSPLPGGASTVTLKLGHDQRLWLRRHAAELGTRDAEVVRAALDAVRAGKLRLVLVENAEEKSEPDKG